MGSFLVCGIFIFKIHLALLGNSVGEINLICLKDSKITLCSWNKERYYFSALAPSLFKRKEINALFPAELW